MRWLVVAGSPPLSCRPSRVAHAQPPGPGLPAQAPSVHTSSGPPGAGSCAVGRVTAAPCAQAACAQLLPDFAISSPGAIPDAHTAQRVAYFAVIATREPYPRRTSAPGDGPPLRAVAVQATAPLLLDAPEPPHGDGDEPGDEEEQDDAVARVVQRDRRDRRHRPGVDLGLVGEDPDQLDRADDQGDGHRQRGDRDVVEDLADGLGERPAVG